MTALRRRLAVVAVAATGLFGAGLLFAGAAAAHASVVDSDPVDGSRIAAAPGSVSITFDEPVGLGLLGYLHTVDSAGHRVDLGAAYHPGGAGTRIAVRLRGGLGAGTYLESYRVVSADAHPVAGTVRFVVGTGPLTPLTAAPEGEPSGTTGAAVGPLLDLARWVSYAGLAVLGGAWLLLTVWPAGRDDRHARTLLGGGLAAAALGAAAELALQGPYAAGRGPAALGDWSLLDATVHTRYGQYHCARLLLLGLAALVAGRAFDGVTRRRRADALLGVLGVGVAVTAAAAGHAATTAPAVLSVAADTAHLTAMSCWAGGLVMLLGAVLPRGEQAELRAVLPAFSRVAFGAVTVLAVTGGYAAWRGIGTPAAILGSRYGLLVLAKIAGFAALLALGNLSRTAVQRHYAPTPVGDATPGGAPRPGRAEPDPPVAVERVRRAVLVEVAVAGLVLAATAILVAEPRGREALAAAAQRPVSASTALGGARTLTVTVDPGRHGTVTATVALSPGPAPVAVTATAALPARQLGPLPLRLTANGPDLYGAAGVLLPAAGDWVVTVVVTTSDFDATSATVTVPVA